jgi:hypothetical protein
MDPLSIIASSITLLGASISTSEAIVSFISGIRNLPAELRATTSDVAEFRAVLVELEASTRLEDLLLRSLPEDGSTNLRAIAERLPAASPEARSHIERSNSKLSEIELSEKDQLCGSAWQVQSAGTEKTPSLETRTPRHEA